MVSFWYGVVVSTGLLGAVVAAALAVGFRSREAALFVLSNLSLFCIILPTMLSGLGFPLAGTIASAAAFPIVLAGFLGSVVSGLFFFAAVFPSGFPRAGRIVRPILVSTATILSAVGLFYGRTLPLRFAVIATMYLSCAWCVVVGFAGLRGIADRRHRRPLSVLLAVYAFGLPFMALDSFVPEIFVTLPLFFVFLNAFGLWSVVSVLMERSVRGAAFDSDSYDLSPREAEVAALLASGASNARIAEALFVSEKTVETHLSRIYRKTGVRGRYEFIALASGSANQGKP